MSSHPTFSQSGDFAFPPRTRVVWTKRRGASRRYPIALVRASDSTKSLTKLSAISIFALWLLGRACSRRSEGSGESRAEVARNARA